MTDTAVADTATTMTDTGSALDDTGAAIADSAVNPDAPASDAGSCGCRTAGGPAAYGWLALALLGLGVRRSRHM